MFNLKSCCLEVEEPPWPRTPVWLINFIGTWYDIDVFDCEWLYWLYSFLVVVPELQSSVHDLL